MVLHVGQSEHELLNCLKKSMFRAYVFFETKFSESQGTPLHKKFVSIQYAGWAFMSEIQASYENCVLDNIALCIIITFFTGNNTELNKKIEKNSRRLRLLCILGLIVVCLCVVALVISVIALTKDNDKTEADSGSSTPPTAPSDEWKLVYKATIHMTPSVYDTWTKRQPEITYPKPTVPRLSVASSCANCWYKDPLVDNWQNAKISLVNNYHLEYKAFAIQGLLHNLIWYSQVANFGKGAYFARNWTAASID